ncbi:MAG: hypothetical protein OEX12_08260 [Gammaproteobacteria bacterium]|nr:hypothetical protein [Gammaproteobacteria bacterium]
MSDKQAIIKEMLEMQHKFMAQEKASGVTMEEYYSGDLVDYRKKYMELANQVIDMAHADKGSHR